MGNKVCFQKKSTLTTSFQNSPSPLFVQMLNQQFNVQRKLRSNVIRMAQFQKAMVKYVQKFTLMIEFRLEVLLMIRMSTLSFYNFKKHGEDQSSSPHTFRRPCGSTCCQVFKWGVQNWNDFCLKNNILKGNYWILRIGAIGRYISKIGHHFRK